VLTRRLTYSCAKFEHLFNNSRVAWRTVIILIVAHSCLLMYSAFIHSPTLNEPAHLAAGLSCIEFGRFDVYRVNPPAIRSLAAMPVWVVGYQENWSGLLADPRSRPSFGMGVDLVEANGDRSYYLFMLARWICIPFSWLGAVTCYMWGRDLYSRPAGLLACSFWCFEPNILAHASLMTPDAHAAAIGVFAGYMFFLWLEMPTWSRSLTTGGVLGLALLAKTTLLLLYPSWLLAWCLSRWSKRRNLVDSTARAECAMLATTLIFALYVLNLGYGFDGSLLRLEDYRFSSQLLTGSSIANLQTSDTCSGSTNRFSGSAISQMRIPLPKEYVLGIDEQQCDFESYNRPSYLGGEWREKGWWYYYFLASLVKVPLGLLALTFGRLLQQSPLNHIVLNPALSIPATCILFAVSLKAGFSEHYRYILPVFPFAFIWVSGIGSSIPRSGCGKSLRTTCIKSASSSIPRANYFSITPHLIVACLSWFILSSVSIYPHSLSYFNEAAGGPLNGSKHLLGSNLDWGQDLRYVEDYLEKSDVSLKHEEFATLLLYFGGFDPSSVGLTTGWLPELKSHRATSIALADTPAETYASHLSTGSQVNCDCIASISLLKGDNWAPLGIACRGGKTLQCYSSAIYELRQLRSWRPITYTLHAIDFPLYSDNAKCD
jgi:hypothetical protein